MSRKYFSAIQMRLDNDSPLFDAADTTTNNNQNKED